MWHLNGLQKPDSRPSLIGDYCNHLRMRKLRKAKLFAEHARRLEAERASELKASFIATMSHELRTPLNAIIGFANLLVSIDGRSQDPAKVEESANYIKEAGHQLLDTINKMLEISKIQAGSMKFEPEVTDIHYIITRSVNMLRMEADKNQISLSTGDLSESCNVIADETRSAQIINNIISNAIKYNKPNGRIDIHVEATEGFVEVIITDTGIGMSEDELKLAITPFGRVQSVYTQAVDGTGLGLCIAKELMEFQEGRFRIESEKEKGTRVTLGFKSLVNDSLQGYAA